jgi:hypothetical protein
MHSAERDTSAFGNRTASTNSFGGRYARNRKLLRSLSSSLTRLPIPELTFPKRSYPVPPVNGSKWSILRVKRSRADQSSRRKDAEQKTSASVKRFLRYEKRNPTDTSTAPKHQAEAQHHAACAGTASGQGTNPFCNNPVGTITGFYVDSNVAFFSAPMGDRRDLDVILSRAREAVDGMLTLRASKVVVFVCWRSVICRGKSLVSRVKHWIFSRLLCRLSYPAVNLHPDWTAGIVS